MMVVNKQGIVQEGEDLRYVQISTNTRYDAVSNVHDALVSLEYLDENPTRIVELEGSLFISDGRWYLPGGTELQPITGETDNIPTKEPVTIVRGEESYYGGAMLTLSAQFTRIIIGGKVVVAGIVDSMRRISVVENHLEVTKRTRGSIEETGVYEIKLAYSGVTILAKYYKEWCGCQNNVLELKLDDVEVVDPLVNFSDNDLAEALQDND